MKTSKLLLIQAGLNAPKSQINKFGGYTYRSCEDILEAVKPLLVSTKTTLTISDEVVSVGDRIYVKSTATLKDSETGDIIEWNTAYAREEETKKGMDAAQITGAASSYARKYALNGLFCIDDVKDADATNDHGKAKAVEKAVSNTEKVVKANEDNPQGWFQKAVSNTKFMQNCLDEDDWIKQIKGKYTVDEITERQLRDAYKKALNKDEEVADLLF